MSTVSFTSHPVPEGDKEVNYILNLGYDNRAAFTAPKGVNNKRIKITRVARSNNNVTFHLEELVAVELSGFGNSIMHSCSCTEHSIDSPCAHVYWALDQVIRAEVSAPRMNVILNNAGELLQADIGQGRWVNLGAVFSDQTPSAIKSNIQRRTSADVRLKFIIEEEQIKVDKVFLRLSEGMCGYDLEIAGARTYNPSQAHNHLKQSALKIFNAFIEYNGWLRSTPDAPEDALGEAISGAAKVYLLMMRGIVLRHGIQELRDEAGRGWARGQQDCFWARANMFFQPLRSLIGDNEREALASIVDYLDQPGQLRHDELVMRTIESWLNV